MEHTRYPIEEDRLLREPEVLKRVGMSRMTWRREVEAGNAPRPAKLTQSGKIVAWSEREISGWITRRLEARIPVTQAG